MKSVRSRILQLVGGCIFVVVGFAPLSVEGDTRKQKRVYPLTRKGAASELPTVKSVSGDKITIGRKTYQVTEFTKVTVNGSSATIKDLKPGMQVLVAGGVLRYGKGKSDTLYKATRINATADNKLEAKRKEFNRKQQERARKLNRRYYRNRRR